MFTRKHYAAMADLVSSRVKQMSVERHPCQSYAQRSIAQMAQEMADYFAKDNPKFNRAKFLEACGL